MGERLIAGEVIGGPRLIVGIYFQRPIPLTFVPSTYLVQFSLHLFFGIRETSVMLFC